MWCKRAFHTTLGSERELGGSFLWLDRFAKYQGFHGKDWAIDGLLPYSEFKVLSCGFFQDRCLVSPKTLRIPKRPERAYGVAVHWDQILGDSVLQFQWEGSSFYELVDPCLPERGHCVAPTNQKAYRMALKLLSRARRNHVSSGYGGRYFVDAIGLSRAWPVAERLSGSIRGELYMLSSEIPGASMLCCVLLARISELIAASPDLESARGHALPLIGLIDTVNARKVGSGQPLVLESEIRALQSVIELKPSGELSKSYGIMVFLGADIHFEADKASMLLGATALRTQTLERKAALFTGEGPIYLAPSPSGVLINHYLAGAPVASDTSASRRGGECIRYCMGVPWLYNSLVDEWLRHYNVSAPPAASRLSNGWRCVGVRGLGRAALSSDTRVYLLQKDRSLVSAPYRALCVGDSSSVYHCIHQWVWLGSEWVGGRPRLGTLYARGPDLSYTAGEAVIMDDVSRRRLISWGSKATEEAHHKTPAIVRLRGAYAGTYFNPMGHGVDAAGVGSKPPCTAAVEMADPTEERSGWDALRRVALPPLPITCSEHRSGVVFPRGPSEYVSKLPTAPWVAGGYHDYGLPPTGPRVLDVPNSGNRLPGHYSKTVEEVAVRRGLAGMDGLPRDLCHDVVTCLLSARESRRIAAGLAPLPNHTLRVSPSGRRLIVSYVHLRDLTSHGPLSKSRARLSINLAHVAPENLDYCRKANHSAPGAVAERLVTSALPVKRTATLRAPLAPSEGSDAPTGSSGDGKERFMELRSRDLASYGLTPDDAVSTRSSVSFWGTNYRVWYTFELDEFGPVKRTGLG